MKRFLFVALLASILMSFALPEPSVMPAAKPQGPDRLAREKFIDLTLHTNEGCTVRFRGTLSYTLLGFNITGFTGQIILSGPGSCPNTTLTVSYAARNVAPGYAGMFTDRPELCSVNTVKWFPADKNLSALLNDTGVSNALVQEMKKGICTNADIQ